MLHWVSKRICEGGGGGEEGGGKQHISMFAETDRCTLKFNSGVQEEMSPIQHVEALMPLQISCLACYLNRFI